MEPNTDGTYAKQNFALPSSKIETVLYEKHENLKINKIKKFYKNINTKYLKDE